MRKKWWTLLLIVGMIPFIVPLVYGIYNSINGFSGLCLWPCDYDYGFNPFFGNDDFIQNEARKTGKFHFPKK